MITFFLLFILSVFICMIIGCVLTAITVASLYAICLILDGIAYIYYKIKGNNNED